MGSTPGPAVRGGSSLEAAEGVVSASGLAGDDPEPTAGEPHAAAPMANRVTMPKVELALKESCVRGDGPPGFYSELAKASVTRVLEDPRQGQGVPTFPS